VDGSRAPTVFRYAAVVRRLPAAAPIAVLALAFACGPPRAAQFVGADGSRDWWTIQCRGDEEACWNQAKAACQSSFTVHELRAPKGPPEHLDLQVHDGVLPTGTSVSGKVVVMSCAAPTVAPKEVAGPECLSSPPRPNTCDDADGETFTTGRRYLARASGEGGEAAANAKTAETALNELRTISDALDADVAALAASVAAVDGVVKSITDFPRTFRMKPARVKALVKGALANGNVAVPADVRAEAVDDLKALLASVKETGDALTAAPAKATALVEKVATARARVPVLTDAASRALDATVIDPHVAAADRAKAKSELVDLPARKTESLGKLDEVRARATEMSETATQALARLRATVS